MKVTDLRRKLMAALAAGGLLAPAALHAADLNINLVVNGTFEDVDTSISCCGGAAVQLNGWADGTQRGFAYHYDQNYDNGGPLAGGGSYYFTPNGNATGTPDVTMPGQVAQSINVSTGASGSLIATGTAAYRVSAFFSSYLTNNDFGTVHLAFLDAGSNTLGTASISDTNTSTWTETLRGGLIPTGTATVLVSIFGTPLSGGPDGYIDNVDFRISNLLPSLSISVNRDNGSMTLSNQTGAAVNLRGYSITSAFESLVPANWLSIADNYDAGSPGPNQVDGIHHWSELTDPNTHGDLSEADLDVGTGASLANGRVVNLGNAGTWIQNPNEDLVFQYVTNGQVVQGIVNYSGNGGLPFAEGDLDVNGTITSTDWAILRTNQHTDLSGRSLAEAYRRGDLTGDLRNDHADFVAFKALYDAANGAGSFVAMIASVPEPSSVALAWSAGVMFVLLSRRKQPD